MRVYSVSKALLMALLCLLQACSSQTARHAPPPVVDKGLQAPVTEPPAMAGEQAPSLAPLPQQSQPGTASLATRSPAVVALLDQAERQANAGELESAAASLERAIRIDPRNAVLWYHLATVRLSQGQLAQAEQLATKSNSLAPGNAAQQARNWRLIGEARRGMDNPEGATAAESRARELELR